MTTRGRGSTASSPGGMLWSLAILVASVAGGLAAAALVTLPSIWIAVAIPAIIGPAIARAVLYRRPGLAQERGTGSDPASRSVSRADMPSGLRDGHYRGHERPAPAPAPAEPTAVVQVLPVPDAPPADAPWWEASRAMPPSERSNAGLVATPDLSAYLASALIAQCPCCGAFKLDIRHGPTGWACRCEACGHTWTCQPGTAWPQVRIAPRRRTRPTRPDPDWHDSANEQHGCR
jgi:hypothetical protein